jgi:hypothetical protein
MHVKKFIHTKTRDKLPGDLAGIFSEAPRAGVSRVSGPAAGFALGWVRRVPRGRQAGRCDDTVEVPKISVSIMHLQAAGSEESMQDACAMCYVLPGRARSPCLPACLPACLCLRPVCAASLHLHWLASFVGSIPVQRQRAGDLRTFAPRDRTSAPEPAETAACASPTPNS